MIFFSFMTLISGANVDIKANVYNEYSLFTYIFHFEGDENYKSFSFEKPKNAKIDYAIDDLGETVKIGFAGDYFIVEPQGNTENKTYEIRYISSEVSQIIKSQKVFSQYINFNFPVKELSFILTFQDQVGVVEEVFPRYYEQLNENSIKWNLQDVQSDTLFLINFEKEDGINSFFSTSQIMYLLGWIVLIALVLILVFIYIIFIRRKGVSQETSMPVNKIATNKKVKSKKEVKPAINKVVIQTEEERYQDFLKMYLTENEKDIVNIIRENEGISQYDILNFLPMITKSNLSKIISKLHSKKILSRIRVGKINKIYLGEKIKNEISENPTEKKE